MIFYLDSKDELHPIHTEDGSAHGMNYTVQT